ncbi:hypothetical protein [Runella limosa]|nr:hypothetical protein [Runella limosa]
MIEVELFTAEKTRNGIKAAVAFHRKGKSWKESLRRGMKAQYKGV